VGWGGGVGAIQLNENKQKSTATSQKRETPTGAVPRPRRKDTVSALTNKLYKFNIACNKDEYVNNKVYIAV